MLCPLRNEKLKHGRLLPEKNLALARTDLKAEKPPESVIIYDRGCKRESLTISAVDSATLQCSYPTLFSVIVQHVDPVPCTLAKPHAILN